MLRTYAQALLARKERRRVLGYVLVRVVQPARQRSGMKYLGTLATFENAVRLVRA
jgi:hypothetical protein